MEPLTFYFDRNVGKRLPEALRLLGLPVIHHHTLRKDLGMKSVTPAEWKEEKPSNSMRLTQFRLPKAEGDAADGELAF